MGGKLARWNQYGYDVDVFDKYREAVRRSNRGSIRVLSVLGIADALLTIVFGIVTGQALIGLAYCLVVLAAGVTGAVVSFRRDSSRKSLLRAGYFLSVAFYMIAIYGTVILDTDAFWVGVQVAVGCYLLDYAWRVGLLQILSYFALRIAWNSDGVPADVPRLLFSTLFLAVGLITFYTMNRTRISLILGREESRRQADTDQLTGLTIRTAAQEEIEEHLKTDEHGVMMLLDLDRFKSVNDRLGHQMGDKVLTEVAADLKRMFRNSDVLSRLGGDEFVVYMKSVPEKEWALQRASHVVREVRRWVGNGTTNVQVTASVGVVMTDMVNRTYDDLYRAADIAMYSAKAEGGNKALLYSQELLDQRESEDAPRRIDANNPDRPEDGGLR